MEIIRSKNKSLLEEIKVASCQDEKGKEKKNEEHNASASLIIPALLCDDTVPTSGIQGQYGIISLFDGVSSVVRILKQKLQQPPSAIILAELDEKIRGLVCAEFGYRSDEQWGYTTDGTACRYVRDVNTILKDNCYLLRQVVAMYPNLKWFVVGGSPCQDLTFAGPSQGLLGLVGSQSRLFFVLLCVIRTMQVLVGSNFVRFLVENAGSMKPVHFVAFCKLLGLPHNPMNQYIWDLAKYTPLISRKRNFFRNFEDVEPVQDIPNFFNRNSGPLIDQKGHIVAFAPLLRTREVPKFGICRSSWTLYQPHALVWDYSFWGSKEAFSSACKLGSGKVPCLCWDRLIPPPFLDNWKKFISLLQKKGSHANDYDPLIGPLLPMFNCKTYKLPMRLLQESEIMNLSGLGDYWVHTSIQDSEKLHEALIRDTCGNSFHPALISSALGSNETIRHWIDDAQKEPHSFVACQHQALSTYTELCDLIQTEISKNKKSKKKPQVINDLPHYPIVEKSGPVNQLPIVAPAVICGVRIPEITKPDQYKEHCIEAALLELNQKACMLFNRYGIGDYFDAFRACVRTPFTFDDYCRVTICEAFAKHSVPTFYAQLPNKPVAEHLQRLQKAFVRWEREPVINSLLALLLDAVTLKSSSSWAVGHLVLIRKDGEPYLFYVGSPDPKLLLLIDGSQMSSVTMVVLGVSAYSDSLSVGCVPIAMQFFREVEALSFSAQLIVEHDRGKWFLHCGNYVTQQGGCIPCFLRKLGVFEFCPWHPIQGSSNHCSELLKSELEPELSLSSSSELSCSHSSSSGVIEASPVEDSLTSAVFARLAGGSSGTQIGVRWYISALACLTTKVSNTSSNGSCSALNASTLSGRIWFRASASKKCSNPIGARNLAVAGSKKLPDHGSTWELFHSLAPPSAEKPHLGLRQENKMCGHPSTRRNTLRLHSAF